MKSQQQELSIKTNCKQCAFAVYNKNTQVSCEFDRINKFGDKAIPAYDEEKEFYVIDTLCSYYRHVDKGYSSSDKDKVIAQSAVSFDLIINCNYLSKNNRDRIVRLITKNLYHKDKLHILLLHEYCHKSLVQKDVSYIARNCDDFVINISVCSNINQFLHDYILKSKRMCHVLVNDYEKIPTNIFSTIDNFVNDKLGKFLAIKNNGQLCVGNTAYRMCSSIHNESDYQKNMDHIVDQAKAHDLYIEI